MDTLEAANIRFKKREGNPAYKDEYFDLELYCGRYVIKHANIWIVRKLIQQHSSQIEKQGLIRLNKSSSGLLCIILACIFQIYLK